MTLFKSPLELYKLLPQTNCRKCGLPSCLAFAAAVIKGDKRLEACPHLTQKILDTNQGKMHSRGGLEQEENEAMAILEAQVANLDLAEAAQRC
jgi:CO dehydrogenase/acetyl-CoA synthase gamma subunit (corrinoid Fe-S protein)